MSRTIKFFDTTLRDGEQTPGVTLNVKEKIEIAKQLELLKVDIIEAGFPNASQGDFDAVQRIAQEVKDCSIAGLCRCVASDIQRASEALKVAAAPRIHVFLATSDVHMTYKLKMSREEVLENAIKGVKLAKGFCNDVEFSAEDASRSDRDFLCRVVEKVIAAGATTVNIPDTVGYAMPGEFAALISYLRENVPNIDKATISVHCHNDLGVAVANSLAAIRAGANQVECTINGLGERGGNASLEEIVMALKTRSDYYNVDYRIETPQIYRTSRLVDNYTGIEMIPIKPIVGLNAFRHESGIHQHGVMMERTTYEIMTPESVGIYDQDNLVLGKLSGHHAFEDKVKELGYSLTPEAMKEAFKKFKELADRKKDISAKDISAIVEGHITQIPALISLADYQIFSGNRSSSTANVTLETGAGQKSEAAIGDGPIDAAYNAIDRIVDLELALDSYGIKAVTGGKDALGEVVVRVNYKNNSYMGKGISTDIIESSILAYVNAVNRIVSENPEANKLDGATKAISQ